MGGKLGGHPQTPAKGAMPLMESPVENSGESREATPLWWGSRGYPPIYFHPLLLQEKGARGMRYQYFHASW